MNVTPKRTFEQTPSLMPQKQFGKIWLRFSTRTLILCVLFIGSGTSLWWYWNPWVLVRILKGHDKSVRSATFSPDGSLIATASADGTSRVWDTKTGVEQAAFKPTGSCFAASFSLDGKWIVSGISDNTARVWNPITGTESAKLTGHTGKVNSAVYSTDGAWIATASDDKTARIWDTTNYSQLGILHEHTDAVQSVDFSPDGKYIVTASRDGTARKWDAQTYAELMVLKHSSPVCSAVFSPDGNRILTASSDGTIRLWNSTSGVGLAILKGPVSGIQSAAFSLYGDTIVTAGNDGAARVWSVETEIEQSALKGHQGAINTAVLSFDDTEILTAGDDHTARIWFRNRPDGLSGILSLWQFWLSVTSLLVLTWSLRRDVLIRRMLVAAQDAKEKELLRAQLSEAEARVEAEKLKGLAEVGEMAATLNHELRNAVNPFKVEIGELARIPEADTRVLTSVKNLQRGLGSMEYLMDSLKDLSKPIVLKVERISLLEAVGDAVNDAQALSASKGIKFQQSIAPDVIPCDADPHWLKRVLYNLLKNGAEALEGRDEKRLSVNAYLQDRAIRIDVTDSGPGMTEETLDRLFESFFSTKGSGGTGLGLRLSRRVIELHHGKMEVKSEIGVGTTFSILLPNEKALTIEQPGEDAPSADKKKKRRLQFSLRTAIVFVISVGLLMGGGFWYFSWSHSGKVKVTNHSGRTISVEIQTFIDHDGSIHPDNIKRTLVPREEYVFSLSDDKGYWVIPYFEPQMNRDALVLGTRRSYLTAPAAKEPIDLQVNTDGTIVRTNPPPEK